MTYVPELPKQAHPTTPPASIPWLDAWMEFAQSRAITAPNFLLSGGIWLIGLVTARRAALYLTSHPPVFNTHYVWWVAPTTYYRKSTGLRVIQQVARQFPHLMLPNTATPEVMKMKLAAQDTKNQGELSSLYAEIEREGQKYAAQRGFVRDEATGLFEKDYQTGIRNLILEWDNNPEELTSETVKAGKLIMSRVGINILFADTPAAIAANFGGSGAWTDGLFARFAFVTPQGHRVTIPRPQLLTSPAQAEGIPDAVLTPLQQIYDSLPAPDAPARTLRITEPAIDFYHAYTNALHNLTAPNSTLDIRLFGTYGRLPHHLLRVAVSLTLITNPTDPDPTITPAILARAWEIVESWRRGAHEMLEQINRGPEAHIQDAVLRFLKRNRNQPSAPRHIQLGANINTQKALYRALHTLKGTGEIVGIDINEQEYYCHPDNLAAASKWASHQKYKSTPGSIDYSNWYNK